MGATSGARTAYPSGAPEFIPGFQWGSSFSICRFMCMFCKSLFVLLYFFFWSFCCLSFFDIRILISPGIFKLVLPGYGNDCHQTIFYLGILSRFPCQTRAPSVKIEVITSKVYCRHHGLVNRNGISVSKMTSICSICRSKFQSFRLSPDL